MNRWYDEVVVAWYQDVVQYVSARKRRKAAIKARVRHHAVSTKQRGPRG